MICCDSRLNIFPPDNNEYKSYFPSSQKPTRKLTASMIASE
jgi:hypothetical protein